MLDETGVEGPIHLERILTETPNLSLLVSFVDYLLIASTVPYGLFKCATLYL